ncbi:rhodanese-like domain-containing protein [Gracilibacillus oryzae]|uniref:Rhodanese-like domain-containing protein n=1 Tax=Gracilibacillus oryzae TaxID=1672701 RepID=A0A7C8GRJ5_9BACI|nr:rhodanese-like domain-containing protein [Gracilibacillus oryzae]KAB8128985.1 rhodanese-like domain-containing protein [Gracilibacillus oryzae]
MKEITAKEVETLLNKGTQLNILDVREADEVKEGKISGAVHIPLGLVEYKLQDLDKSKEYIIVCLSGGRSGRAAQLLESKGFNVTNMTGGMLAWQGTLE